MGQVDFATDECFFGPTPLDVHHLVSHLRLNVLCTDHELAARSHEVNVPCLPLEHTLYLTNQPLP